MRGRQCSADTEAEVEVNEKAKENIIDNLVRNCNLVWLFENLLRNWKSQIRK
jgi:hypothetical protein